MCSSDLKEALLNLAEMIAVASEEDHDMFTHLEEVEQMLLDEEAFCDNPETD